MTMCVFFHEINHLSFYVYEGHRLNCAMPQILNSISLAYESVVDSLIDVLTSNHYTFYNPFTH